MKLDKQCVLLFNSRKNCMNLFCLFGWFASTENFPNCYFSVWGFVSSWFHAISHQFDGSCFYRSLNHFVSRTTFFSLLFSSIHQIKTTFEWMYEKETKCKNEMQILKTIAWDDGLIKSAATFVCDRYGRSLSLFMMRQHLSRWLNKKNEK